MNFRRKQVAPSGGEILNHPLQQTWDFYIKSILNVAENTVRKAFGSSPSLSLDLPTYQEDR